MNSQRCLRTHPPTVWKTGLITSIFVASLCRPLWARDRVPPISHDRTTISGTVLSGGRGVAGLNEAAGIGNAQANSVAIANGKTAVSVKQSIAKRLGAPVMGSAAIAGHAFSGFTGILSINQVSGDNNAEANVVAISRNWQPLPSHALGEVAAHISQGLAVGSGTAVKGRATISAEAFKGTSGVIQVSQVVGASNRVANSFSLNISVGAAPSG